MKHDERGKVARWTEQGWRLQLRSNTCGALILMVLIDCKTPGSETVVHWFL